MIWAARLISLLALAASLPFSQAEELDVWAPRITYPDKSTSWSVGEYHHVVWDASNAPSEITNPIGKIYLVKDGLIDLHNSLASNFDLKAGQVQIQVPHVKTGKYQLDLFGDSGDRSDYFTIVSE